MTGNIDADEMKHYLAAVYNVLYHSSDDVRRRMDSEGATPAALADLTTKQCFDDMHCAIDGAHVGMGREPMNFEKFREWYDSPVVGTILGRGRRIVDELDAPYDFPDNDDDDDDDDSDDESAGDGRYRQGPATRALPSKSLGGSHVPPPASWEDHPVRKARRNSVKLRFD